MHYCEFCAAFPFNLKIILCLCWSLELWEDTETVSGAGANPRIGSDWTNRAFPDHAAVIRMQLFSDHKMMLSTRCVP